jgi:hypothetical protein
MFHLRQLTVGEFQKNMFASPCKKAEVFLKFILLFDPRAI